MYLGIDLGTSGVTLLPVGEDQRAIARASTPLEVQRPQPVSGRQEWLENLVNRYL